MVSEELYKKFIASDWCPLLGFLFSGGACVGHPIYSCWNVITDAREIWDIKYTCSHSGVSSNFYPTGDNEDLQQKLASARSIADTYPEVINSLVDYDQGYPESTLRDGYERAISLVKDNAKPTLGKQIEDYHILAILAIMGAHDALKRMIIDRESSRDPSLNNEVHDATALLSLAQSEKIKHLQPKASYADEKLLKGNVFRRKSGGDYWDIVYDNKPIQLKHMKGLEYIYFLLKTPGQEFHVLKLTDLIKNRVSLTEIERRDAMVDTEYITSIRKRYDDLNAELEDDEIPKSDVSIAKIVNKMEQIKKALSAGTDNNGRPRDFPGDAEKARKAVSKAVNTSLNKIRNDHPSLWKHFTSNLTIGTYCSYKPEKPILWKL
ncbi:MAG: hypothetical protein MRK01_15620 [Candidatus Scalindua sp.]|nr:hypothetical protein [Candidatus Scalindua sp.]